MTDDQNVPENSLPSSGVSERGSIEFDGVVYKWMLTPDASYIIERFIDGRRLIYFRLKLGESHNPGFPRGRPIEIFHSAEPSPPSKGGKLSAVMRDRGTYHFPMNYQE